MRNPNPHRGKDLATIPHMSANPEQIAEQMAEIGRGAHEILVPAELEKKLRRGQPLRIKAGFDPTAPDLHLGHTVLLNKMRAFQQFGHEVTFLIGDFTGLIGDPTGRNVTRPPLTPEDIQANARTYQQQVFKILDPVRTIVDFNSRWLGKLTAVEFVQLSAKSTVARMLERDDFSKRYKSGQPISIHEFLYPLAQGYDSVAMRSDVELGGADQRFNLLVGRQLQEQYGQEAQVVVTVPLLEGLDGVNKMAKSLGNYVAINDAPADMFGKLMSISDQLMWRYFELLSFRPLADLAKLKAQVADGRNPRDVKFELGLEIVARFHSAAAAASAQAEFVARSHKVLPTDLPEMVFFAEDGASDVSLTAALSQGARLVASGGEARRKIAEGAVRIDGEKVSDAAARLPVGAVHILQVGSRRFARLRIERRQ
jgi:tyrosyl-tRNA synthetase